MQAYTDSADVIHFIGGKTERGAGDRTQAVFNPATGAVARRLVLGEATDVDAAVASAKPRSRPGATRRPFAARASCCAFSN